jgi:hypothetical protein
MRSTVAGDRTSRGGGRAGPPIDYQLTPARIETRGNRSTVVLVFLHFVLRASTSMGFTSTLLRTDPKFACLSWCASRAIQRQCLLPEQQDSYLKDQREGGAEIPVGIARSGFIKRMIGMRDLSLRLPSCVNAFNYEKAKWRIE